VRPVDPVDERLSEGDDEVAAALREIRRVPPPTPGQESAAWRRLSAPSRHGGGAVWVAAASVVAAAVLVLSARRDHAGAVVATRAPAPARPESAAAPATPAAAAHAPARARAAQPPQHQTRLALAARPCPLPVGLAALADEATVEVGAGTRARASADDGLVRVVVDRGEVLLHVDKRTFGGPAFEVAAGPYRFRVLGTKFRVARSASTTDRVELWVEEGRVAVSWRGRELGIVEAGGYWAGRATRVAARAPTVVADATAATPPPGDVAEAEPPAPAAPARGGLSSRTLCAELAASPATARDAVNCYLGSGDSDGVASETALFEAARLRRDALRDAAGALETFQLYRARFPRGMLRAEVDLSIIELLPKLNRHREAVEEIGRMLAGDGGRERAAELLFLRGNIYREVLEDFARAERDYAGVEAVRAPEVGDATFFRGVCLQAVGRADEARAAFERYLAAGPARFTEEATRRLRRLAR
jgi:ferric-dicitrate binding protein FerR (iron transport regulator)